MCSMWKLGTEPKLDSNPRFQLQRWITWNFFNSEIQLINLQNEESTHLADML